MLNVNFDLKDSEEDFDDMKFLSEGNGISTKLPPFSDFLMFKIFIKSHKRFPKIPRDRCSRSKND